MSRLGRKLNAFTDETHGGIYILTWPDTRQVDEDGNLPSVAF